METTSVSPPHAAVNTAVTQSLPVSHLPRMQYCALSSILYSCHINIFLSYHSRTKASAHALRICQIFACSEAKRTSLQNRFQATAAALLPTLTLHTARAGPQNNEMGFAITELKEEIHLTF